MIRVTIEKDFCKRFQIFVQKKGLRPFIDSCSGSDRLPTDHLRNKLAYHDLFLMIIQQA